MSPDELESFLRGLHPGTLLSGRNLLTRFDFSGYRSLLDVGGGSGGLAITITEAYPQMRAVVVDLPTVTPITQKMVMGAGAQDRVSVTTADVVREPLSGHYDVAALSSFIQVLSPEEASRVLRNVSEVLEPGGTIYILGRVLDNSRLSPEETMYFNLVFISIYDGGQAYTEDEYREWLTEAGFEDSERVVNPNGTSIIRARKGA
jgi:cyclopropane fatty-acyl-phospholipid synthase-like methyltransferase